MEQAETVEALDNQLDALYGIDTTQITENTQNMLLEINLLRRAKTLPARPQ